MTFDEEVRENLARNPNHPETLLRYCLKASADELPRIVSTLTERIARPPVSDALRLLELRLLVTSKERLERRIRGLPGKIARNLSDTDLTFARAEAAGLLTALDAYLQRKPNDIEALIMRGETLASLGRLAEAHGQFAKVEGSRHVSASASVDFDPLFHAALDEMEPALDLPEWTVNAPGAIGPRTVFIAGDGVYFDKWGRDFREMLKGQDVSVALHLMDCRQDQIDGLTRGYFVSSEITGFTGEAAREYYHAIRFVRLLQFAQAHPDTAILFADMDSILEGSLGDLFARLAGVDLMPYFFSARLEPRNKISAHM